MSTSAPERLSARDRLLASAGELFYAEGIHTVGIDRVIEHAGVAKASLYKTFGSKDELIRAYLETRHASWQERTTEQLATRWTNPGDRILGMFDLLGEAISQPGFRGCALINASAESSSGPATQAATLEGRKWKRELFTTLATEAGITNAPLLAEQLSLLYDGAQISGRLEHDPAAATAARAAAATLLAAAARA